jgi:hypothetical protein
VRRCPHDTEGKRQAVLRGGTRRLFDRAGFRLRPEKVAKNIVMLKVLEPVSA